MILLVFAVLNLPFITIEHQGSVLLPVITTADYGSSNVLGAYVVLLLGILRIYVEIKLQDTSTPIIVSIIQICVSFIGIIAMVHNPLLHIIAPEVSNPAADFTYRLGSVFFFVILGIVLIEAGLRLILHVFRVFKVTWKSLGIFTAAFIIAVFLSTLIHESGHAILVLLSGGSVTYFGALPWQGYVSWTGVPEQWIPIVQLGGFIAQHSYLLLFAGLLYLERTKKLETDTNTYIALVRYVLIIVAILAWLDFPAYTLNNFAGLPHWFFMGSANGDVVAFCQQTNVREGIMSGLAILEIAVGLGIIYKRNPDLIHKLVVKRE